MPRPTGLSGRACHARPAMIGNLHSDVTVLLRDALAWIEAVADEMRRYLNDPNRHPGGTNETSVALSKERREVVEMTLDITTNLSVLASAHLTDGAIELAVPLVVHGQACVGDAMRCLLSVSAFETVRVADEVRTRVVQDFAEKRSADARKGAPKPTFDDNAFMRFMNEWRGDHNGRMRGSQTAAALEFGVTEAAIRKRLKKIRTG